MLQGIENAQTRRAYALISALAAKEITLDEFSDALRALPSEILQISATMLALMGINEPVQQNFKRARLISARLAAATRSYN